MQTMVHLILVLGSIRSMIGVFIVNLDGWRAIHSHGLSILQPLQCAKFPILAKRAAERGLSNNLILSYLAYEYKED